MWASVERAFSPSSLSYYPTLADAEYRLAKIAIFLAFGPINHASKHDGAVEKREELENLAKVQSASR